LNLKALIKDHLYLLHLLLHLKVRQDHLLQVLVQGLLELVILLLVPQLLLLKVLRGLHLLHQVNLQEHQMYLLQVLVQEQLMIKH
jgi:hypothetical protein